MNNITRAEFVRTIAVGAVSFVGSYSLLNFVLSGDAASKYVYGSARYGGGMY